MMASSPTQEIEREWKKMVETDRQTDRQTDRHTDRQSATDGDQTFSGS